jgi:zinc transporter ZupT
LIGFLAALLVVAAKNCISPGKFKVFAGLLYAFSCGALIGDAAIHILPESFTNPEIEPKLVSLIFIASIVFFLILERIFASLGIAHEHWVDDNHSHKS